MNQADIKAAFDTAHSKAEEARSTRATLEQIMLEAMRNLLPPGLLLDLNEGPGLPEHLFQVRTERGHDRGTRMFRVVRVVSVEADPLRPTLSAWICDAVPVSEKTGKDMSAATHASRLRETVRLRGRIVDPHMDETVEQSHERLYRLIAANTNSRLPIAMGGSEIKFAAA